MTSWEGDFWAELMEEQGVPMGTTTGRFTATGGPDAFFYAANPEDEYVSPYLTEDTLVGEIVEDEHVQLPEIGA